MSNTRKKRKSSTPSTRDTEKNNTNNTNTQITPTFAQKKEGQEFTGQDYANLCENEHQRYLPNSRSGKVGHAVIVEKEGEKVAYQYDVPQDESGTAPTVRPLIHIEEIERFGKARYRATTPEHGTTMYAKRDLHAFVTEGDNEKEMDFAYFSPSEKDDKEPFWGGGNNVPLFRDDLTEEQKQELKDEMEEVGVKTKGGEELVIDSESVRMRDANPTRKPDQNTVMGESARDAYEAFMESMTEELSPKAKEVLKRAVDAPLRNAFYSNYRPEWLHAEGFSLTPMSKNPQRKDNLGAAPKWANTEMMVLERLAKWFALNIPGAYVSIKPHFEMLLDSELIKNIKFEVTVKEKNRFIRFLQDIDPIIKYPLFRKPSDLAQSTAITHRILKGIKPISEQKVSRGTRKTFASLATSKANSSRPALPSTRAVSGLFTPPSTPQEVRRTNNIFPTELKNENSIVQVSTTFHEPDYREPWLGTHVGGCRGTGFVVEHEGKKYVLTNAHCVENAITVRVRLANDRKNKYEATRKCVSYQCDLALLEVMDPKFNELVQPLTLGEMVKLEDKVQTVGFPMGGDEISISKGIVSRIEVEGYEMGEQNMLQVQVDAAINHGNSGGPVFSHGKVVGVAFQGIDGAQGLSYMIPAPIIKHFLKEAFSNRPYRGFPSLPVHFQTLENPMLRKHYGMTEDQTGLRIYKVDDLSDASTKLQANDILLEIDSLPVSNEGTVDIPGVGNCIDLIHVSHMKFIGDSVRLKILRKDPDTHEPTIHHISVTLDHIPYELRKVAMTEHDKMPTFYIASGISFAPVTHNYIHDGGRSLGRIVNKDGSHLTSWSKKAPDEQLIVVDNILDCEETLGYEGYVNSLIKEVNGKPINNIKDVVSAMEGNDKPIHTIVTSDKFIIAVKNMGKKEHDALLKRYHIERDRSEDLLSTMSPVLERREKPARASLPSEKRFIDKILELEERYKDCPVDDDEEENDDEYDIEMSEEMSEDHEENNEESENEMSDELTKVKDRHRLFHKRALSSESSDKDNKEDDVVQESKKRRLL
jgi:S1-C subfamily serine protease